MRFRLKRPAVLVRAKGPNTSKRMTSKENALLRRGPKRIIITSVSAYKLMLCT